MVTKGTHEPYNTELFMPVMKDSKGKYLGVLSDDSVDRDDESISRDCIMELGRDDNYLAALCNHQNDVFMQVAEWTNKGVKNIDGNTALIAEPKFYKSNPNAMILKGMLDEGAKIGVSIGAIVKEYDDIDGKIVYTKLELVEASFVAVPSNRHGRAMAVAKSFNKKVEVKSMEKEYTKEDVDSAVEKKLDEKKAEFTKQLESKDEDITKLKKELEESKKECADNSEKAEKAKDESKTKLEESEKKLKDTEENLEKTKKEALEKQNFANQGGDDKPSNEDVDKALKEGKLPYVRTL